MTAKVMYTAEQTAELVAAYKAEPTEATVALFATKFGKTVKSIVAKLSREQVYVKRTTAKADGTKRVTKDEVRITLELLVGAELPSFDKASMKDMQAVIDFIKREG